jgi:hypothetical protein
VQRVVESFEHCTTFDDQRQFLVEHVERVIYDHYRVTVIGSVPIKMQLSNSQEIETRKIAFCLRGEIDKSTLHTKPRKKYAEDGRLNAYGAGGRNADFCMLIIISQCYIFVSSPARSRYRCNQPARCGQQHPGFVGIRFKRRFIAASSRSSFSNSGACTGPSNAMR